MIFNSHTLWAWVVQGYLDWMFWSASSKRFEMSGRQAWIVNRKSERFLKISKGDNTNECLHKCHLLFSLTHKCNSLCLFKYSLAYTSSKYTPIQNKSSVFCAKELLCTQLLHSKRIVLPKIFITF